MNRYTAPVESTQDTRESREMNIQLNTHQGIMTMIEDNKEVLTKLFGFNNPEEEQQPIKTHLPNLKLQRNKPYASNKSKRKKSAAKTKRTGSRGRKVSSSAYSTNHKKGYSIHQLCQKEKPAFHGGALHHPQSVHYTGPKPWKKGDNSTSIEKVMLAQSKRKVKLSVDGTYQNKFMNNRYTENQLMQSLESKTSI